MAEESMVSTAESGISGFDAGPAGGGAAAQADMITKKLANYWCLIGSIPLVLFLLVALPTIYYVKTFSDYVNAYYCDTKSCKDIADAIEKAGAPADACGSFSAAACKGKTDYIEQLWTNVQKEFGKLSGDNAATDAPLPFKYKQLVTVCAAPASPDDPPYQNIKDLVNTGLHFPNEFDIAGHLHPADLSGQMSAYGVDGMVRAVAFLVNSSQGLELSAPVQDMYPIMLLDVLKKKFGDVAKKFQLDPDDESQPFAKVEKFAADYANYVLQTTSELKGNIPIVVTKAELVAKDSTSPEWQWKDFFDSLEKETTHPFADDSMVRLSHPGYFLGLNDFINKSASNGAASMYLQTIMYVTLAGPFVFPEAQGLKKALLCHHWADRVLFGVSGLYLFAKRSLQFGAPTGINPNQLNTSSMALFVRKETNEMLESMSLSYSLALSAAEKGRANFHTLVRTMEIDAGAFYDNSTKALADATILVFFPATINFPDDMTGVDIAVQVRQNWAEKYWKYNPEHLRFRDPMGSTLIYATYNPTEQHLYVPMGVFTKPFFRNTKNNRAFAALGGYAVLASVMKALTSYGSFVRKNELYPQSWTGLSWVDKMVKYQKCLTALRVKKGLNGTLHGAADQYMLGAVLPAFRYFRRMVFRVAFPRPEFRIDWISSYSSTQIFYYTWAMMHCGTDQGKVLIDLAATNSKYFQEGFECKTKLDPKRCQLWESSRRKY